MLNRTCALLILAASLGLAAEHKVIQENKQFDKTVLTVRAGDAIVFSNADAVTHNVHSRGPVNAFTIRKQAPGESSTVEFPSKGTTEVRCTIHPKMKLKVTVE